MQWEGSRDTTIALLFLAGVLVPVETNVAVTSDIRSITAGEEGLDEVDVDAAGEDGPDEVDVDAAPAAIFIGG